jgi:hypothetical protein
MTDRGPRDEQSTGPAAVAAVRGHVSDEAQAALRTWLAANTPWYPAPVASG